MNALALQGYEGLASLKFIESVTPALKPHAASMNPIDVKFAQSALRERFKLTLPHVLGRDCAGVIVAAGKAVTTLKPGDEVYAVSDPLRWGAHAEEVAVDVSTVSRKPDSLNFVQAASLPLAGLSALAGLETVGAVQKGERVLIHAGAGGVGSLAIQLAKHLGAFVATTTRSVNFDFVRRLGADIVIDYKEEDFSAGFKDFDFVFDTVGGDVRYRSFAVLRTGGRLVHLSTPPMTQAVPREDVTVTQATVSYQTKFLDKLTELVRAGAIRPLVWRMFPFRDSLKTYEAMSATGVQGKIVIEMNSESSP